MIWFYILLLNLFDNNYGKEEEEEEESLFSQTIQTVECSLK